MSFSDLMSSSRGPGVIGMVIALMVLLGFGILFTFAFDEDLQGNEQSIESVLRQQRREIDGYVAAIRDREKRLDTAQEKFVIGTQLEATRSEINERQSQLVSLNETATGARDGVENEFAAFEQYKEDYRAHIRAEAIGEMIDELTTLDGEVYKKVEIREVTPIGIQIRHEDGQKRIVFEKLSDELKERFQFDPKKKDEAVAQENDMQDRHDTAVAVANQSFEKQQSQDKLKKAAERKRETAKSIAVLKARTSQLNSEARALEDGLHRQTGIKRTSEIQAAIRAKREQIVSTLSEIRRLETQP